MKTTKPYPYLYRDVDRKGRTFWRMRAPGRKTVTIKGAFGSPEFAANYKAALEGEPISSGPVGIITKRGTIANLAADYFQSPDFTKLAAATKKSRRSLIEKFVSRYGKFPVRELGRKHVKAIIERERPGTGRNLLSALRMLMARAIDQELIDADPTINIKRPKLGGVGWHSWTEAEIAKYEARHPIGTQARLGLALALYTGQRRADLTRMGASMSPTAASELFNRKPGRRFGYRCTLSSRPCWMPRHPIT